MYARNFSRIAADLFLSFLYVIESVDVFQVICLSCKLLIRPWSYYLTLSTFKLLDSGRS